MFYNRYVPPSSKARNIEKQQRPSKKPKWAKTSAVVPPEQYLITAESKNNASVTNILNQNVKREKDEDLVKNDQDVPLRSRHQTVFFKYEKAKQQAAEKPQPVEEEPEEVPGDAMGPKSHGLEPLPQPAPVEESRKVSMLSALPEWLQSPILVSSADTLPLDSLPLNRSTIFSLRERGFQKAFAIQSAVLPMLLPGPRQYVGDLCISAATGSGKTLAYILPMVESLREKPIKKLRGLIVVPTRELVNQVKETLDLCSGGSSLNIGTAVGSKTLKEEQASLVERYQKYEPEAYRAEQGRKIDEDEELMDWDFDKRFGPKDDFELLYNHVVEYSSKVDILICTPGRLVEHLHSTTGFTLEHVQWLVIDEVDQLLDGSFQQWVDTVLPALEYLRPLDPIQRRLSNTFHLLRRRDIRKITLSATMTREISKLTALKLRRPRLLVLDGQLHGKKTTVENLESIDSTERVELPPTLQETSIKVSELNNKPLYLVQLLLPSISVFPIRSKSKEREPNASPDINGTSSKESSSDLDDDPQSSKDPAASTQTEESAAGTHGTLIFTKTNEHATRLAGLLCLVRPSWASTIATLTKSTTSSSAQKALSAFRKRKISILIASDRASRGLDILNLAHVINYDMPSSLKSYVHRVGRTARAGKEGKATTLVADHEARWFWNEIARNEKVGRGQGKKVQRRNMILEVGEEEREAYERALEKLGEEARGRHE